MRQLRRLVNMLTSTTGRLALTYLMIIMVMSVGFSVVFYKTSSRELGRQIPPDAFFNRKAQIDAENGFIRSNKPPSVDKFLHERVEEGRNTLLMHLIFLNGVALVVGSVVSYKLARRTLQPIEVAMESQAQFVSDASHELRTPLAAIRASNEVALRKPKLSAAEARQLIVQNTEDVVRLSELSEALLGLVPHEGRGPKLGKVSLQSVVTEAMNQCIPQAQKHGVSIDDAVQDLSVHGEESGLVRAVIILLDNAIKYSHSHGTVYVSARARGKYAYLKVRDEGIGIRASDVSHIFRRFYRADAARTKGVRHGYGLGLAIAQQLVAAQHGEILVKSTLGEGSSFTIKLPLS